MEKPLEHVPGAGALEAWFGYWPTFLDAEILSLSLHREGASELRIHTWETSDRTDWHGYYESEKHVVVTFALQEITALSLSGFSPQNAISGLTIQRENDAFVVAIRPRCGLGGSITAKGLSVQYEAHQAPIVDPQAPRC